MSKDSEQYLGAYGAIIIKAGRKDHRVFSQIERRPDGLYYRNGEEVEALLVGQIYFESLSVPVTSPRDCLRDDKWVFEGDRAATPRYIVKKMVDNILRSPQDNLSRANGFVLDDLKRSEVSDGYLSANEFAPRVTNYSARIQLCEWRQPQKKKPSS